MPNRDEFIGGEIVSLPMHPSMPRDQGTRHLRCPAVGCTQVLVERATEEFILRIAFQGTCPMCGTLLRKQGGQRAPSPVESAGD